MSYQTVNALMRSDAAETPNDSATIGATSGVVVPANDNRVAAYVCNDHATNIVYLSLGGTAVANEGIRLNAAGGAVVIYHYSGVITAIASGADTNVIFSEV